MPMRLIAFSLPLPWIDPTLRAKIYFLGQERNAGKTLQVRECLIQEGGLPCLPVGSTASFIVHFGRSWSAYLLGEGLALVVVAGFCALAFEVCPRRSMAFSDFAIR